MTWNRFPKPRLETSPCVTETPVGRCHRCARRAVGLPKLAEDRPRVVAIDPLAILEGPCPLFIPAHGAI